MKYVILAKPKIDKYLVEFKKIVKEVTNIDLNFNLDSSHYIAKCKIDKKTFHERNSLMEDVLGYGYKEKIFGKHLISSNSDKNMYYTYTTYKYSFSNPDHFGIRFVMLFTKREGLNLDNKKKDEIYYVKAKVSALDTF